MKTDYQLSLETKNNLKRCLNSLRKNYTLNGPQMAEYETALVVWAKKRKNRSTGSIVKAKVKDKMKLERLNLVSYLIN
jgi:hypothetical protein